MSTMCYTPIVPADELQPYLWFESTQICAYKRMQPTPTAARVLLQPLSAALACRVAGFAISGAADARVVGRVRPNVSPAY